MTLHIEDLDHSNEERWVAIGMSNVGQIIVVIYTFRDDEIRLISAPRANKHETNQYAK